MKLNEWLDNHRVIVLVIFIAIMGGIVWVSNTVANQPKTQPVAVKQVPNKEEPQKPYSKFGDGVYEVGVDIKPGVYKTTGQDSCYYARLSSLNTDDVIDNNITDGPATVEIKPTDKAFRSDGCAEWVLQN